MTPVEASHEEAPLEIRDITGTVYVMWRCSTCGAMGRLYRTLPATCHECQGPREELYYWPED